MTFSKIFPQSFRRLLSVALGVVLLGGVIGCEEEGVPSELSGDAARDRYGVLNATFYVDKISASTTETLGYNSWGFPNKKKFNFRACFKDQLLRGALQNWDVVILDGTSQKLVQTDFGGCANWSEVYSFDYFAPESYIEVRRVFNVTGGHSGDVAVVLGVNPWSGSVVDLRYDEIVEIKPNAAGPSTFTATMSTSSTEKAVTDQKKISLTYQGHAYNDFEIDHNLSLKVAHYYQVEFSPKIFRRTLAKAKSGESPEQGLVRVKAILLRDSLDNPDLSSFDNYITAFEHTFNVDNGSVKQQIILKFPDITAISTRMKALVRVEPIVDSPSVQGANFEGYLGALPGGSFDLVASKLDVNKIYNEFTTKERQIDLEGASGIGTLLATSKTIKIESKDLEDLYKNARFNSCYYQESLDDPECKLMNFAIASCFALGLDEETGLCAINPRVVLNELGIGHQGWIVENRAPVKVSRHGITHVAEDFSMTLGINRSQDSRVNFNFGLNAIDLIGVAGAVLGPIGGAAGVVIKTVLGYAGKFFNSGLGWSYARSVGRNAGVSSSQRLALQQRAQEFSIETKARFCTIFKVTNQELATKWGATAGATYHCDDTAKTVRGIETYYYVNGGTTTKDAWTDGDSLAENPYLMFFRGPSNMELFREIVRTNQIQASLSDTTLKRGDSKIPQAIYQRVNQSFPGMISEVVSVEE